jgi:hypothetical protein
LARFAGFFSGQAADFAGQSISPEGNILAEFGFLDFPDLPIPA